MLMKPAYWIGILALVGGVIGYATTFVSDWSGVTIGVVAGIVIGAIINARLTKKTS